MTGRRLHPWLEQLLAQNGDPWAKRDDPNCAACRGTGTRDVFVYHGPAAQAECWECQGTGLEPWARKKDTE